MERWVKALRDGATDIAWELTHSASREAIGGRDAFDDDAAALAEGYGAWAESENVDYTTLTASTAGARTRIVLLRGTIAEEGPPQQRADAVPVRAESGRLRVDPFHDLTSEAGLEIYPEPGSTISPEAGFEVYLAGGREVALFIDNEQIPATSQSADGDKQHVTGTAGTLREGPHTLTVVVVRDGLAQARAVTYTVSAESGGAGAPAATKCEQVAFTPNSEDAASDITVTGATCEEARAFVRAAGTRTSSGGPDRVDVEGYRCVRTASKEDPLPQSTYECAKDGTQITFLRT